MLSIFRKRHKPSNEELLLQAARTGDLNLLEKMLAAGTNIECRYSEDSNTPLLTAVSYGQHQIVIRLLAHHANFTVKNESGFTPLALAAYSGKVETSKALLDAGAEIDTKTGDYHSLYGKTTPLGLAVMQDHADMVTLLIDRGADVNAVCLHGRTPLMMAVGSDDSTIEIASKLLENGAKVNVQDNNGRTPLMGAVLSRRGDLVTLLLEHGASTSKADKEGETAFSFARNRFYDETCLKILNHHVNQRHRHHRRKHRDHHEVDPKPQASSTLRK